MSKSKLIEAFDIRGLGRGTIRTLNEYGINTYGDFAALSISEQMVIPGIGRNTSADILDYYAKLQATHKKEIPANTNTNKLKQAPTTLEYFAGLAMQGILAKGDISAVNEVAEDAVAYAQELIEVLKKAV